MPFCTQCGAENLASARYCDQCGAELVPVPDSAPPQPVPQPASSAPSAAVSAGPSTCPQCGTAVIPGEAFCDYCGAALLTSSVPATGSGGGSGSVPPQPAYPPPQPVQAAPAPAPAPTPAPAPAPPAARTTLAPAHIQVQDGSPSLPLPKASEAVVGRADPASSYYPDIDLSTYGALQQGVGRRHMRLFVQQNQIFVEDMDSTNGTFLNRQKLAPNTPQPIKDGDELRLGKLILRIYL